LERLGATMEQRWGLEGENEKEEGSEDSPRESQEEGPSSVSC